MGQLEGIFAPATAEYEKAGRLGTADALLAAIDFEERIYIRLLTEHYDDCTLFFSRSDGSSVETMLFTAAPFEGSVPSSFLPLRM